MGRELKRVPLDFNYPIGQVWKGYISPYKSVKCNTCGGTGLNPATKKLQDDWYSFSNTEGKEGWSRNLEQADVDLLWAEGRLYDFKDKPTAEQVNEWSRHGMGHDGINSWICVKGKAERLGIYGECPVCKGEGELWFSDEIKTLVANFKGYEPPTGEGFQLWETTSEGSPTSPVFKTLDELCEWLANNATTFASYKASKDEWKQLLTDNFVSHKEGSMIFI